MAKYRKKSIEIEATYEPVSNEPNIQWDVGHD